MENEQIISNKVIDGFFSCKEAIYWGNQGRDYYFLGLSDREERKVNASAPLFRLNRFSFITDGEIVAPLADNLVDKCIYSLSNADEISEYQAICRKRNHELKGVSKNG